MNVKTIRLTAHQSRTHRIYLSMAGLALCAAALGGAASSARAAGGDAQYESDVARCNSGQTNQDRATCLKEAGASQVERRRNGLSNPTDSQSNATARCNALPAAQRQDCLTQMSGQGSTTVQGSVQGGGVLRETVIPVAPGSPGSSTTSPQPAPLAPPPVIPPSDATPPSVTPYGTPSR
jgi:hypothetical protein